MVGRSFNLWTFLGRRLSLLGVVAHYLDSRSKPRAVLSVMPQIRGSHNAINLSDRLTSILDHFKLRQSFGYTVTDNASKKCACLDLVADDIGIDASLRYVLCMGHIINLVAYKVLFGSTIEVLEYELSDVTAEVVKLAT